eukprot:gene5233-1495_t
MPPLHIKLTAPAQLNRLHFGSGREGTDVLVDRRPRSTPPLEERCAAVGAVPLWLRSTEEAAAAAAGLRAAAPRRDGGSPPSACLSLYAVRTTAPVLPQWRVPPKLLGASVGRRVLRIHDAAIVPGDAGQRDCLPVCRRTPSIGRRGGALRWANATASSPGGGVPRGSSHGGRAPAREASSSSSAASTNPHIRLTPLRDTPTMTAAELRGTQGPFPRLGGRPLLAAATCLQYTPSNTTQSPADPLSSPGRGCDAHLWDPVTPSLDRRVDLLRGELRRELVIAGEVINDTADPRYPDALKS